MASLREVYADVVAAAERACAAVYGDRLEAIAVFGSVGRGTPRPDSDIDLLVVARDLPRGRLSRVDEFREVERLLERDLEQARRAGVETRLSPVFRTPEELEIGGPLLLDLTEDAVVLRDSGCLAARLARLRRRLDELGARRIWRGNAWYWDLKPDYRAGEVFEI